MKKQNRNILAYASKNKNYEGSPKQNRQGKENNLNKNESKTSNQSIYQTIMDQMDSNECQYINKLIEKG